jgi:L-rhamnose mutarotase
MVDEGEIRVLYGELQGILSQTPKEEHPSDRVDARIGEPFNNVVELVAKATGTDYSRFLVQPETKISGQAYIDLVPFRQKVNALIMHLHCRYFSKEIPPFSGPRPSNVNVSTNVSQSQTVYLQMALEFQGKMDEKLASLSEDSKERKWWKKVKDSLGTAGSIAGLLNIMIRAAIESGLDMNTLHNLMAKVCHP